MQHAGANSAQAAGLRSGAIARQPRSGPGEVKGSDQRRRDVRAMVTSVAGISYRVIDAGLKLLIIPMATRLLGIEQYGVWLTANALLSLLMVSDFGIGSGVVNAVSGALAEHDVASARSYLSTAYAAFGVLALYLAGTVAWLAHTSLLPRWLGIEGKPLLIADSRELFLVLGLLISAAAFSNVITFFVSSLQEGYLAHCALIAASLTALLAIVSLRTRSMSHFALASSLPILAVYLLLTLYVFGVRHRNLLPAFSAIKMSSFRVIWRDGSRLLIAQIADTIVAFTSSVLVARYLGATHVPEVSVSLQVMMIVNYVACMFLLPLWPAYVEADKRNDQAWILAAFRRGAWRSMACIVAAAVGYTVIYRQFIHRWSALLPIPPLAFVVVLGCWFLIYIWNKNAMVLLNALGLTGVRARVAPVAAIVFVVAAALILPHLGILAIPIAGCISSLLEACFTTTRAFRVLRERKVLLLDQPPVSVASARRAPGQPDQSWVVVHDAWRDRYQLPAAFAEAGMLRHFVTDWYTPADRPIWPALLASPLGGAALGLRTRFSPLVASSLASDQKGRFLAGLIRRKIKRLPFEDTIEGAKSGRRAAAKANAAGAHLFATSYSAAEAFADLRPELTRLLFQVHPQPRFLQHLYQTQSAASDDYAGLVAETEFDVDEAKMQSWEREARLADHILCASSFTKRSLCWSGIAPERISVIPYGVDTELFRPAAGVRSGTFKVLFVGQRMARKGLRALLRVWKQIAPADAELILGGGHQADAQLLHGFEGMYTDVPRMNEQALVRLYQSADVFVLPSIAEGFGHVYLEALACGTPVLCTENTGAADLVVQGKSGWVLPAGDATALEAQLRWILQHREQVRAMSPAARACAEQYTWPAFRASVRSISCAVAAVAAERTRAKTSAGEMPASLPPSMPGDIPDAMPGELVTEAMPCLR